ncbi:MAG: hypothetical protein V4563_14850 [Pseudomonadota bacterium]
MSEVICQKCGGYVPGHATGAGDICTCEPITNGDKFRIAAEKTNALNMELYGQLAEVNSKLAFAREVLEEVRPLVKGRLLDLDGPHGDRNVLERIKIAIDNQI